MNGYSPTALHDLDDSPSRACGMYMVECTGDFWCKPRVAGWRVRMPYRFAFGLRRTVRRDRTIPVFARRGASACYTRRTRCVFSPSARVNARLYLRFNASCVVRKPARGTVRTCISCTPLPRLCVHVRKRGVARAMRTYAPTCVYAPDAEYSPGTDGMSCSLTNYKRAVR